MASNPNNQNDTGRQQLSRSLVENAGLFQDAAVQMAQGATATQAATGALKNAALDKLLGPTSLFAGGMIGVLMTFRKIVKESQLIERGLDRIAKLQGLEGKFTTLLKSAELAKKRIEELYKFTANSPFKFDQVAEANRVLQALTKGAFAGADAMTLIGDAASASGQDIAEVAERVGKLYNALASGRSLDKIIMQLQMSGLATEELIGKFELLETQGASFAEKWAQVEEVLKRTEGGMKNDARNLDTLNTKLSEARQMMAQAFGASFVEAESRAIDTLTKATVNLTPVVARMGEDFAMVDLVLKEAKTSLLDSTLAANGMASALLILWEAAKVVGGAVGVTMVASIVSTTGPLITAGKAALNTGSAFLKAAETAKTLADAKAALTAAGEALGAMNLRLAATETLVAAKTYLTVGAQAVHKAGVEAAAGATGLLAVRNYLLAASTVTVGGAMAVAGRLVKGFVASIGSATAALLANPWFMAAAAVLGLVSAITTLRRSYKEAESTLSRVNDSIDELNRSLKEQFAMANNTDKWAEAMARLSSEIVKADHAMKDFQSSRKEESWTTKLADQVSGGADKKNQAGSNLIVQTAALRQQRVRQARSVGALDVGSQGSELYAASLQQSRTLNDQAFSTATANSDPARQAELIASRRRKLEAEAAKGKAARNRIVDMETNSDYQTQLARTDDASQQATSRLDDVSSAGVTNADGTRVGAKDLGTAARSLLGKDLSDPEVKRQLSAVQAAQKAQKEEAAQKTALREMRKQSSDELTRLLVDEEKATALPTGTQAEIDARNVELKRIRERKQQIAELVANTDKAESEAKQLAEDERKAKNQTQLNAAGIGADRSINAAIRTGDQSKIEEAKFNKDVLMLDVQIAQAKAEQRTELTKQLQLQKEQLVIEREASRLRFQRDRNLEGKAADAAIRRDKKGARAIQDAQDLEAKIQEYKANGMTEAQAKSNFKRDLLAEAANRGPQVVADSIQRVGGGGGASVTDPIAKATERAARAAEMHTTLLTQIRDKLGQRNPIDMGDD